MYEVVLLRELSSTLKTNLFLQEYQEDERIKPQNVPYLKC